jgi:hypothetical protein
MGALSTPGSDRDGIGREHGDAVTPRRLLLVSYPFPPLKLPMAAPVAKAMAALTRLGWHIDVVCADGFEPVIGRDDSLLPYAESHFPNVSRLIPRSSAKWRALWRRCRLPIWDFHHPVNGTALRHLLAVDLSPYAAVMTWAPYHSVNTVMLALRRRRRIPWLAEFSDPWAGNPLEKQRLVRVWNWVHEWRTVREADHILFNSPSTRDLMLSRHPEAMRAKTTLLPHCFEPALYPARAKARNEGLVLRFVGNLFGPRTPEPLFRALHLIFGRRPELQQRIRIDLVGPKPPSVFLESAACRDLPPGMVSWSGDVDFVTSLEKMWDADILLLIEANVRNNLFIPSKIADYIGARSHVVGIVPPSPVVAILDEMGAPHARPNDLEGIAAALLVAIDRVLAGAPAVPEPVYQRYTNDAVARVIDRALAGIAR